jgi:UDP-N-acetylmuramate--alanine ligase
LPTNQLRALLKTYKKIHFIGIGGISMSALAEILKNQGYEVTGSDLNDSDQVENLRKIGIPVVMGHKSENIGEAQLVIHTAAIPKDNCELAAARLAGIPIFERSILLGCIMQDYSYPVAIAGTHGKTTTTSFVSQILLNADCDPTCLVGGQLSALGGNFRVGKSEYLICEACEYVDSFLTLQPKIAVVLNIEEDHLDYFSGLDQIKDSFRKFVSLTGEDGICIVNADDTAAMEACGDVLPRTVTFGIENPDAAVTARNITSHEGGFPSFDVYEKGKFLFRANLKVPGRHNIYNALAATATALTLGIDISHIQVSLGAFTGTKRRFEYVGTCLGATIVDDYAHHPTEITATLSAAKALDFKRVICIFQPHTYTRTIALFDQFAKALKLADMAVIADIYAARESNPTGISSRQLAEQIEGAKYFDSFDKIASYIKKEATEGDLIFTMGAGNIYQLGPMLKDTNSRAL